jgi:hypothetical protein
MKKMDRARQRIEKNAVLRLRKRRGWDSNPRSPEENRFSKPEGPLRLRASALNPHEAIEFWFDHLLRFIN